MKQLIPVLLLFAALAPARSLKLSDLPPAVRQAVSEQAKGGEIKSITSEKETSGKGKGVTQYEVETILSGRHRDFDIDQQGKLLSVEEEVALDSIPAAAKAAIQKKVASGKLEWVEAVMVGGKTTYEAAYTPAKGKKREFQVTSDGADVKD